MRKFSVILLPICVMILLTSCDSFKYYNADVVDGEKQRDNKRFVTLNDEYNINGFLFDVIVDTKTSLIYLHRIGDASSGITPFFADETGRIYTLDEYEKTK